MGVGFKKKKKNHETTTKEINKILPVSTKGFKGLLEFNMAVI